MNVEFGSSDQNAKSPALIIAEYYMRLIQARRLARCRKALEDPLQAHRKVSEIAYSWGFSDMTHFGRKFKAAYGLLPGEYRRLAKQSD